MYREEEFSRLEISLPACLENYKYFRSKLSESTRLLVLVKANAYGHGAVEFASLMKDAGADYFLKDNEQSGGITLDFETVYNLSLIHI